MSKKDLCLALGFLALLLAGCETVGGAVVGAVDQVDHLLHVERANP